MVRDSVSRGYNSSRMVSGLAASLAMMMGSGTLLLQSLIAMAPAVRAGLHLSQLQFGLFTTAAFGASAVSVRVAGTLTDRLPRRTVGLIMYASAVVAVIGASGAPSFSFAVAAVGVSGIAMAFSNPLTNRIIVDQPDERRGLLIGIKQSGVQVAQSVAGLALPAIGLIVGWRGAVDASLGFLAIAMVLAWRFTPDDRLYRGALQSMKARPMTGVRGAVWWLFGYALLSGAATQTVSTYLPLFGFDEIGLQKVEAGLVVGLVGGAGIVARIGWGQWAMRMQSTRILMAILALVAALSCAGLLAAGLTQSRILVWASALLFAFSGAAVNAVTMATTIQLMPPAVVGRATGTVVLGQYAGFAGGAPAFGALSQGIGYTAAWGSVVAGFIAAAIVIACAGTWLRSDAGVQRG